MGPASSRSRPRTASSSGARTGSADRGELDLARVVERCRVAAIAAKLEAQRTVDHAQVIGDQLLTAQLVAGDDARHGLRAGPRLANPDGHMVADSQPLPSRLVRDFDFHGAYCDRPCRLPGPREVPQRVAAQPTCIDALERFALRLIRTLVHVHD